MEEVFEEYYILGLVYLVVVVAFVIYRIYKQQKSAQFSDELIEEYYRDKGIQVTGISKLSAAERIKYGVPLNPFIKLYTSTFSMFSGSNESICRSVETIDESGAEHIRYVEVNFTGKNGITINEFEVYEF